MFVVFVLGGVVLVFVCVCDLFGWFGWGGCCVGRFD